ncbi:hypothetical protein [uncultured Paracoccus sp.]|uniref:hypothetical protein n=1 Tax=uncultured Paracoccus sp. TaxID=189685 RepID=UPI00262FA749|nr:hypothetical protein [uncultured Paracoccus sp.]
MAIQFNPVNSLIDFSALAPLQRGLEGYSKGINQAETVRLAKEKEAQQRASYNSLLADPAMGLDPAYRRVLAGMTPQDGNKSLAVRMSDREKATQRPWWAGPGGAVDPAYLQAKQAGANRTTVNMPRQEVEYDKAMGKKYADEFSAARNVLPTATRTLGELKVIERTLADPNLYSGTAGDAVLSLKKAAGTIFGVNVQGVGSGEVVRNLGKAIALGNRTMLPGTLSNADRDFLEKMSPNLTNSPEGNRRIIALAIMSKQYEIDRAKAYSDYARRNRGRIDVGIDDVLGKIDQDYSAKAAGIMDELRGMAQADNRSPAVGTPVQGGYENLRKMYGLE